MGFKAVFDTNFGADLTIMEEASEFVERFTKGKAPLPLITSCCPSWVDFMEKFHSDIIPNFSSCKSPHEMVGALAKTYYASKIGVDPTQIVMVSIMPCTSKKFEIHRSKDMSSSGFQDVDISLTTRELSRMINQSGIEFSLLKEEEADSPLGEYSGAGTIFGATGGVMEAALRTAYYFVTKENLGKVEFNEVRGLEGIKTAEIDIKGTKVKVAVAHGLGNVETVINQIRDARLKGEEPPYHFVEVMACRGGCVAGGGQPRALYKNQPHPRGIQDNIRDMRIKGLYEDDEGSAQRCSHNNPSIKKLYDEFLGAPLGKKSHSLLHTCYTPRPTYKR